MSWTWKNKRHVTPKQRDYVQRVLADHGIITVDEVCYFPASDLIHATVGSDHFEFRSKGKDFINVWHKPDLSDCVLHSK